MGHMCTILTLTRETFNKLSIPSTTVPGVIVNNSQRTSMIHLCKTLMYRLLYIAFACGDGQYTSMRF